jgi:mannose-6-phosphate isomerase-like protein (cupin superfamily)
MSWPLAWDAPLSTASTENAASVAADRLVLCGALKFRLRFSGRQPSLCHPGSDPLARATVRDIDRRFDCRDRTFVWRCDAIAACCRHPAASAYDKGVGEALGVGAFGIYQVELPPDAETVRRNHVDDNAEDVYAVVSGTGAVVVDGHEVPVRPGQFVAVTPESSRHVRAGENGLVFIAVCAPPA